MRMTKINFNFDYKKQEIKKGEIGIRIKKKYLQFLFKHCVNLIIY